MASTSSTSMLTSPSPSTTSSTSSSWSLIPTPTPTPNPVAELWYPDGNIVLEADGGRHFKIFGGLLAARSSVFADMLAFPPPPPDAQVALEERDATIDGCTVVRVYDSAPDLAYFLRAVFDSSFFEPPPRPTTLPTVSAILRLSLKYDVPFLTRRALAHLHTTFPTTLAGWRARDQTRTIPALENTPFVVLQLARELESVGIVDWAVPSAAYCVCSHPFGKTLDGAVVDWAEREVGEAVEEGDSSSSSSASSSSSTSSSASSDADTDSDSDSESLDSVSRPSSRSSSPVVPSMGTLLYTGPTRQRLLLSWADQRALIEGRRRLVQMQAKAALAILRSGAPEVPPPPPPQAQPPLAYMGSQFITPEGSTVASTVGTPAALPTPPVMVATNPPLPVAQQQGQNQQPMAVNPMSPPQFALNPALPQAPVPMAPFPNNTLLQNVAPGTAPPTPSYFGTPAMSPSPSTSPSDSSSTYNLPLLLTTHCPTPASCSLTRLRCADTLVSWDIAALLDYFADNAEVYRTGMCGACWGRFEGVCEESARGMWEGMCGAFGVGGETRRNDEEEGDGEETVEEGYEDVPVGWRAVERERRRAMAE